MNMTNLGAFGPGGNWGRNGPELSGAILPYAGTSGFSGTASSEERARTRDASGRTSSTQSQVLTYVSNRGPEGATIADIRAAIPNQHHGTLSGALTALHKSGYVLRLRDERRDKCSVYVIPVHANDRPTVAPRRMKERSEELNDAVNRVREYLVGRSENSALNDRPVIASSWRKQGEVYNNLRVDDLELIIKALR